MNHETVIMPSLIVAILNCCGLTVTGIWPPVDLKLYEGHFFPRELV